VAWKTLEHGAIEQLAENLWRVEGALPGMGLRRQMIVARTGDGRLLIHNGIALGDAEMTRLEAWGTPTWLVVPNGWHRIDARRYKDRYPSLRVVSPRGSRRRVEQVIPVDATYDELGELDGIAVAHLRGLADAEGVLRVHSSDGVTLVFNDALFNQPHLPGAFGIVYRLLGQSGRPKVTLIARLFMVKDKRAYAEHLHELADTPRLVRVIPAHIDPITENAAEVLHRVARDLSPRA
jgi:hypothetical protein